MKKFPLNIAHRGASCVAPENTIPAFKKAIELGADGIELDVHLSKDGEVVVIHDVRLERTTNGIGKVYDYTLKELKKLDAGKHFSKEFEGTQIPTLIEVIELVKKEKVFLVIEIKDNYKDIEKKVIDIIYKYNFEGRCAIISFNENSLLKVKEIAPNIKTGILFLWSLNDPLDYVYRLKVDVICPIFSYIKKGPREYVEKMKKSEVKINTFTVDRKEEMICMINFGVDAITTNCPQVLYKLKKSKIDYGLTMFYSSKLFKNIHKVCKEFTRKS